MQDNCLTLIYKNIAQRRNRKLETLLQQLFSLTFCKYDKTHHRSLSEEDNDENESKEDGILQRTYITTKLFKLLKRDVAAGHFLLDLPESFLPTLCGKCCLNYIVLNFNFMFYLIFQNIKKRLSSGCCLENVLSKSFPLTLFVLLPKTMNIVFINICIRIIYKTSSHPKLCYLPVEYWPKKWAWAKQ